MDVSSSSGTAFRTPTEWLRNFATGTSVPAVGDFDGDGCDDVAEFGRAGAGTVRVARSVPGPARLDVVMRR